MSPKTKSKKGKFPPASGMSGIDALDSLFTCWPKFVKLKGFKGSHDTRNPAHYDMHLHSQLTLKNIVSFPDMFNQLAGVVDSKMKPFRCRNAVKQLPQVDATCILHQELVAEVLHEKNTWIVGREDMLQKSYRILEQYPALVASTLLTGADEWSNIFHYSEKPTVATTCAEADGYRSLHTPSIETSKLPEDLEHKLRLVIDKDLLFWEFKSMNAGTKGVMLAISHLAGSQFPWFRCPMSKHCDSQFCQMNNNRFRFNVTGNKTGVDGAVLEGKSGDNDDLNAGLCFSVDRSKLDCSIAPVYDTRRWKFKNLKLSKKRPRPESDNPHSTDADDNRRDDDDESNTDDGTLPFTEVEYHKALKIVQQIWAEAVNIDATFIVLNCANLEYVGIRDRKLQRLYLSPLLDLKNPTQSTPGYFKIHTGLEIVALLDAIDRAERLAALPQRPELYTFEYHRSEPYEDKVSSNTSKTRRPSKTVGTSRAGTKTTTRDNANENKEDGSPEMNFTPAELSLFQRLRYAHSLKITWKQSILGFGSPGSMVMTRTPAWPAYMDFWTEEVEVLVMAQCENSTLSYACYVNDGETAMRGIVLKLARFPAQKTALEHEYNMYTKFPKIDGIVDHLGIVEEFGLYQSYDKLALVLLDGGSPVPVKFGLGCIPAKIHDQICEAVKIMHSLRITHGSLSPENILVTKDGKSRKGQWVIHLINWKNGKDYRRPSAIGKIYNDHILRKLERRSGKRNKCKTSKFRGAREGKSHSVIKQNRIQRKKAIAADRRNLRDSVWR